MKYMGLLMNIPMIFIFICLGFAMKKSNIDINPVFGYRTKASKSSKEAWDFANKHFGNYLIFFSIITFIFSLILTFFMPAKYSSLTTLLPICLLIILLFFSILKTENSLRKKFTIIIDSTNKIDSKKNSSKSTIIATIVILVGVLAIVLFSFFTIPTKPYDLTLTNTSIDINGWGSANISLNSIESLTFLNTIPNVEWNSGGGNMNNKIFGTEHLENYGDTKCFVENTNNSSIFIKTSTSQYLIGLNNNSKTTTLFHQLKNKVKA